MTIFIVITHKVSENQRWLKIVSRMPKEVLSFWKLELGFILKKVHCEIWSFAENWLRVLKLCENE